MAGSGWAPPHLEDFILTERLGSGTYATVFKAYRKKNAREVVAVKCVSKKTLQQGVAWRTCSAGNRDPQNR
uniref:Serine/threonine-protein kinase ulk3 n=1 Tax=Sphaerodactylus townsendi TaxID=933632 RepID=A0ACB8E5T1_9SAUR